MAPAIRALHEDEREWLRSVLAARWGGIVAGRGRVWEPAELPALVAEERGDRLGVVTLDFDDDACEVVTIDAFETGRGVGGALLEGAVAEARARGCTRVRLITTNDNLRALALYQRRGFRLVELRPGAVDASRRTLKPSISETGEGGIPIRDELELELEL